MGARKRDPPWSGRTLTIRDMNWFIVTFYEIVAYLTLEDEEKTEGHSVLRDFLHGTEKHIYLLQRVVKIGRRPHISVGQPVELLH